MQAHLSWPAARAVAASGSRVRRAAWTDRFVFRTAGGLHWLGDYAGTFRRVVRGADFGRAEFLALDWTDADPDQDHCVGIEADTYQAGGLIGPQTFTDQINLGSGGNSMPAGDYGMTVFRNPFPSEATADVSGYVDNWVLFNGVPEAGWGNFYTLPPHNFAKKLLIPEGGSFTLACRNAPYSGFNPWALVANVTWSAPFIARPDYYERTVANPFAGPVAVEITGNVFDTLILDGIATRSGVAFEPLSFSLAAGSSFTIAARSSRRDYPYFVGYDLAATFTL
ncbi:MAG: hypothetical protein WCO94_14875 [Verrucomicrobiota bacterium]